eukprot:CAMPEP_0170069096 /NCGR_PEP_ID=MMETSP0019_2-20121128/7879_1 /TAXON_ID=98059 /ORGANISM="Dinobryon sp., Strain UTEXLB2267" /LENGTH=205 /DNA_ID=CAMNT_0010277015 /DNA_START=15 /DNA_END=629 /DNA_ORIENTATION=+
MVRSITKRAANEDNTLRPWTVNPKLELRLEEESVRLEKIISLTSPQKNAGYRGSSVLEKLPELIEFNITLKKSLRNNNGDIKTPTTSGKSISKNGSTDSLKSQTKENSTVFFSDDNSFKNGVETVDFLDSGPFEDSNEDILCAKRIQSSLRLNSVKSKKKLDPIEMKTIHYESRNSPAVLNISTNDFRQLLHIPKISPKKSPSAW